MNSSVPSEQDGKRRHLVILGGGLAGLWAGYRLQKHGFEVSILEQEPTPGGLLETVEIDGFCFDLGPHIFLEEHLPHYTELVGKEIRPVRGFYGVGFQGKEVRSPIQPMNLLKTLGVAESLPMVLSMLYAKLAKRPSSNGYSNVDEVIVARFGEQISRNFFRDYIPKVTGLPAIEVSPDWFLERYRFYQEHNLWASMLGKALRSVTARLGRKRKEDEGLKVFYPERGAQMITDALVSKIEERGGTVRTGVRMETVERLSGQIDVHYNAADGTRRREAGDIVISTLPVTELMGMLNPAPPEEVLKAAQRLSYRRLAVFFIVVHRDFLTEKIQIYFPESRYPFKRIYEPKNLDPTMGEKGKTGICVEVCFGEADGPFEEIREEMYRSVLEGLGHFFGLREDEVVCQQAREVPYAYAIYREGYRDELQTLASYLFPIDNLISYGRQGSFRYNHLVDRVIDAFSETLQFIKTGKSKEEFLGTPSAKSPFF